MAKSKGALAQIAGTYATISPELIDENPNNPNKESKFVFSKLVQNIRKAGFIDPLIVREKGDRFEVIGGAHRLRAARELNMAEVPVFNVGVRSDAWAATQLIALNETRGTSDQDLLANLVQGIREDTGPDGGEEALQLLPYTDAQFSTLLDGLNTDHDDEEAEGEAPKPKPVKLKPADVASALELEGMSQDQMRQLIVIIRRWRATRDADTAAWMFLASILKQQTEKADKG